MMLRSHSINTQNNPDRNKRKQADDAIKNPSEPVPKKQNSTGLTVLRTSISGLKIETGTKIYLKTDADKENIEYLLREDIQFSVDPTDPCPHYDFDKEEAGNLESVSEFANEIFKYYKSREKHFRIQDYLPKHPDIDEKTRAILVDFLVETQETFELNHETLYNAVKIIDMYLAKTRNVRKCKIQIAACAAVFLASKYDERSPPLVDDLVYMAGDEFSREEFLAMERELFSQIDFDLGSPLSYRYLRRLARVSRTSMVSLTLARYILESSLLIYDYALLSGARMAAAAFLLAMKMTDINYQWNPILEKYSGFTSEDILPLMEHLNHKMHFLNKEWNRLANIRNKYSHEVFFCVATTPLLPDSDPKLDLRSISYP
ncbi:unnamed protein product [Caenorhabditis bovis]|uniref:G2/mitotic-specific cyclin-B3 n=1 Tax=Caenorhabditis bovis TaxID=2654633 RepID=A0A8S1EHQ0_9PELO|nr:unnamed protein product [Caenorhabditis bovis]